MKKLLIFLIYLCLSLFKVNSALAFDISKLGVHILNLSELQDAKKLVSPDSSTKPQADIQLLPMSVMSIEDQKVLGINTEVEYEKWSYITIPLTLGDASDENLKKWQSFFDNARILKIIPIVRLTTEYSHEENSWNVPNKNDVIKQIEFLSKLNWPTDQRHIIIYNEVNHAKEWGGYLDPEEYSRILRFASNWAHTEQKNYIVLPAGMDLSAPNSHNTRESFTYLTQMLEYDPEIFSYVDIWNSHSYPNPGFISAPTSYGKISLRGFQYELAFLKLKTGKDYKVMITETGWKETLSNSRWLESYYTYALQHIWSDDQVIAVTPFLLKGSPGPYSGFSFYNEDNQPTNQFHAFKSAIEKVSQGS